MQSTNSPVRTGLKTVAATVAGMMVWIGLIVLATLLTACSDQGDPMDPTPGPGPVASVAIQPKSGVWSGTLKVGQSIELAARPLASDGTELPPAPVTWASTDAAIATVNAGGQLVAVGEGTATVKATIGGRTGTIQVVVTADPPPVAEVAEVRVSPQAAVLDIGATRQYTARAYDADGNELFGRVVTWSTLAPQVASVSATGLVKAIAPGYGEIVATVEGRSGHVGLTVPTPEPVRAVIVTPSPTAVFTTQYIQLTATVIGPNGGTIQRPVTWSSENPEIAMVGVSGMVLGVAKGKARIRATAEGVSGFAEVEVRLLPLGNLQTYDLRGTANWPSPTPYIEIGRTEWTDPAGAAREVYLVVTGGTLTLDIGVGTYTQSFTVEAFLAGGGPNQAPVYVQESTDRGVIHYDAASGLPVLKSTIVPGQSTPAVAYRTGEFTIPQSVLGFAAQPWLWVIR